MHAYEVTAYIHSISCTTAVKGGVPRVNKSKRGVAVLDANRLKAVIIGESLFAKNLYTGRYRDAFNGLGVKGSVSYGCNLVGCLVIGYGSRNTHIFAI